MLLLTYVLTVTRIHFFIIYYLFSLLTIFFSLFTQKTCLHLINLLIYRYSCFSTAGVNHYRETRQPQARPQSIIVTDTERWKGLRVPCQL